MRLFVRKLIDSLKTRTSDRRRSLQRDDDFEHAIRLGNELEDGGEVEAALTHYRRAANLAPSRPRPLMNMGNALRRLARFDEAIDAQRRAVECAPDYAPARFNLALLLADQGDRAAAENELLKALHCQPTMIEARIVLADIYEAGQRFDEAEAQFIEARKLESSHPGLLLNYGLFCFRQGRFDEAYEWLQRARSADPDKLAIHSLLLMCSNCRDEDAEAIAREHFRVGAALVAAEETKCSTWANIVDEDRPLRIGYVSGDFMPHPVPLFLRPVLEQRNKLEFETFCYSNYGRKNEIAERLKQTADRWREIAELDDRQVVELIRDDRIDVLVDLSGHTDRNRLQVFAGHPAPVQVTWLGYLNTTGLPAMDYRICDAHTDPPGTTEHLHTERLVRMPHSQWCYAPWYEHEVVPNAHPDLSDEIVFGSFNQVIKITPVTLSLWSGVLAGVPKATLVVFDVGQAATREALLRNMEDHGIDTSRVTLRGRVSIKDYFAAIGDVDIGLDTAPYNGATTTLDTLWMGVPVVALRGQRATARSTYSILKTLGAEDLIALNDEDYVDINVRLARDRARRMEMRQTLRARLTASPLMDTQRFTNALEKRYREMWRAWCRNGATAIAPKSAAFPSPRDCASP